MDLMFTVEVDEDYSNEHERVLIVTSPDPLVTYQDAAGAVDQWLDASGLKGWSVDDDLYRVGVGITANRRGTGVASRFIAGVTRNSVDD